MTDKECIENLGMIRRRISRILIIFLSNTLIISAAHLPRLARKHVRKPPEPRHVNRILAHGVLLHFDALRPQRISLPCGTFRPSLSRSTKAQRYKGLKDQELT